MESPRIQTGDHQADSQASAGLAANHEYSAPLTSGGALTPTTPTAPYTQDPHSTQASQQASTSQHTLSSSVASSSRPSTSATTLEPPSTSASNAPSSSSVVEKKESSSSSSKHADNPYRSFRVTLEDPCHKVLPAALKKYKINDDWRQYALFICYGNTGVSNGTIALCAGDELTSCTIMPAERCLAYDEKPLLLFQKLKESNNNPVFMLRHIKDIKSPIAVASAKHAARREKRAAGVGAGVDKTPSVNRDGVEAVKISASAMTAMRPTRLHHPPVLLPVGKDKEKEREKDGGETGTMPPSSPRESFGYCISIYPYLAERE